VKRAVHFVMGSISRPQFALDSDLFLAYASGFP
jgi:hypothetical protein